MIEQVPDHPERSFTDLTGCEVVLSPQEWTEILEVLAALSGAVRTRDLTPLEALALTRCVERSLSQVVGGVRERLCPPARKNDPPGAYVERLATILLGGGPVEAQAAAIRALADAADGWMGQQKAAAAAVEALANCAARWEDEPDVTVVLKAAEILAKARHGIW